MLVVGVKHLLTILSGVSLVLASCSEPPVSKEEKVVEKKDLKMLTVNASNDGDSVELHVGQGLALSLSESPSTGYRWKIETEGGLSLVNDDYDAVESDRVGSGGQRRFELVAEKTGNAKVTAVLSRAWENDKEPEESFQLKVTVK